MKRWKKVTIWIASILIIVVAGGLFAANYAVDKVLNSMVGMSVDDLLEDGTGSEQASESEQSGNSDQTANSEEGTDPDAVTDDGDQSVTDASNNPDQPVSNSSKGEASSGQSGTAGGGQSGTNGSGQSSSDGKGSSSGYSAEISTDKAKEVEENITVTEKAKVVTTLMSSLSASDISTLQKLASGGLSVEEKKEARTLLLEKLTEDQYNELIAIAAKHGLSQGRSYAEVKDE